jgi:hypothetical protein
MDGKLIGDQTLLYMQKKKNSLTAFYTIVFCFYWFRFLLE